MKVVFRADASLKIGLGHVMRCLTLANTLRKHAAEVSFICREDDGNLCELIEEQGFAVSRLPAPTAISQAEDIQQTCAAIEASGAKPDWLIVDHYTLDQRWESSLRTSVGRIMVIDDMANRVHDCDLLLDQNMVSHMNTRYSGKVPAACALLLGPKYALLQSAYAELHDGVPLREGPIQRIFIFFGGADCDNLTGRTLSAFLKLNRADIEVDIVVANDGPHATAIRRQVEGHGNIHLHCDPPTLASFMVRADLAVGACGTTSWERLCLGLPSLVITMAENQRPVAYELQRLDLIHLLGHKDEVNEVSIEKHLRDLTSRNLDASLSKRIAAQVDGRGAARVVDLMLSLLPTSRTGN